MRTKESCPKFLNSLFALCFGASAFFAVASCSGNNTGTSPDLSGGDMLPFSCCGHPGDKGNSLGIGQYCSTTNDCTNAGAPICGNDFEPSRHTYFCTTTCDGPDMGTRGCGENTTCTLDSVTHQYGCVPTACLTNMPAGCSN